MVDRSGNLTGEVSRRATIGVGRPSSMSTTHVWKQQSVIKFTTHTAHAVRRRNFLSSAMLSVCNRRVRHLFLRQRRSSCHGLEDVTIRPRHGSFADSHTATRYQRHTEAESSMCCPRAQRSLWTSAFQHDAPRYPGEQTSAPTTCQSRYFAVQRPGQQESKYNSRIDSPS
jgi:hypothetical protein